MALLKAYMVVGISLAIGIVAMLCTVTLPLWMGLWNALAWGGAGG